MPARDPEPDQIGFGVPTLKHWRITAWYVTKNAECGDVSPREYLEGKPWEGKVEVGRKALIKFGVLKP